MIIKNQTGVRFRMTSKNKNKLVVVAQDEAKEKVVIPAKEKTEEEKEREKKINKYIELVNRVRNAKNKKEENAAFNQIEEMLKPKMQQLSYQIKIPGWEPSDCYQEALWALRSKAIKDYDQTRSIKNDVSPFDSFAVLCIRRHLSTKRKSSFQSKQIVLNKARSTDQNRSTSNSSDDFVSLSDIVAYVGLDSAELMEEKENYKHLLKNLWERMSPFEKEVFVLHKHDLSYKEIAKKIYKKKLVSIEETKSVDNALSRIKTKGCGIYRHFDE